MKLRVDPEALRELLEAEAYTTLEFGEGVANEFRLSVAAALEEITEFPERFAKAEKNIRSKVLAPYPFVLIYECIGDTVRVYAFAHAKRKPGYWRKRT